MYMPSYIWVHTYLFAFVYTQMQNHLNIKYQTLRCISLYYICIYVRIYMHIQVAYSGFSAVGLGRFSGTAALRCALATSFMLSVFLNIHICCFQFVCTCVWLTSSTTGGDRYGMHSNKFKAVKPIKTRNSRQQRQMARANKTNLHLYSDV